MGRGSLTGVVEETAPPLLLQGVRMHIPQQCRSKARSEGRKQAELGSHESVGNGFCVHFSANIFDDESNRYCSKQGAPDITATIKTSGEEGVEIVGSGGRNEKCTQGRAVVHNISDSPPVSASLFSPRNHGQLAARFQYHQGDAGGWYEEGQTGSGGCVGVESGGWRVEGCATSEW